jgi:hypothetical protein
MPAGQRRITLRNVVGQVRHVIVAGMTGGLRSITSVTRAIGIQEAAFGVIYVVVLGLAWPR